MTSLRRLAPALSLVALLALAACGTDTDSGGNASDAPSTQESPDESTPPDETSEAPQDAADLPIEAGVNGVDLPAGVDAPTSGGTGAAWTAQDGYLYVVTFGSSSCPMTPVDFEWDETDRTLRFSFGRRDGTDERPCTLDTMPSTSVVVVPGLPADEPVTIRTGAEDVVLPVER